MKKKRTQKSPSGRPKPRTGLLGQMMAAYGFRSVNALCGAAGTSPVVIGEIINGRRPLVSRWGRVNPQAVKVAELLGETPERLFGGPETTPVIPERPVTTVAATGVAMAEKKSPSANSISGWFIVGLLWPITSLTLLTNWKEVKA